MVGTGCQVLGGGWPGLGGLAEETQRTLSPHPIPHTPQTETGTLGASRVVWGRGGSQAWIQA